VRLQQHPSAPFIRLLFFGGDIVGKAVECNNTLHTPVKIVRTLVLPRKKQRKEAAQAVLKARGLSSDEVSSLTCKIEPGEPVMCVRVHPWVDRRKGLFACPSNVADDGKATVVPVCLVRALVEPSKIRNCRVDRKCMRVLHQKPRVSHLSHGKFFSLKPSEVALGKRAGCSCGHHLRFEHQAMSPLFVFLYSPSLSLFPRLFLCLPSLSLSPLSFFISLSVLFLCPPSLYFVSPLFLCPPSLSLFPLFLFIPPLFIYPPFLSLSPLSLFISPLFLFCFFISPLFLYPPSLSLSPLSFFVSPLFLHSPPFLHPPSLSLSPLSFFITPLFLYLPCFFISPSYLQKLDEIWPL
jgi:hypothetical protein